MGAGQATCNACTSEECEVAFTDSDYCERNARISMTSCKSGESLCGENTNFDGEVSTER